MSVHAKKMFLYDEHVHLFRTCSLIFHQRALSVSVCWIYYDFMQCPSRRNASPQILCVPTRPVRFDTSCAFSLVLCVLLRPSNFRTSYKHGRRTADLESRGDVVATLYLHLIKTWIRTNWMKQRGNNNN